MKLTVSLLSPLVLLIVLIGVFDLYLLEQIREHNQSNELTSEISHSLFQRSASESV